MVGQTGRVKLGRPQIGGLEVGKLRKDIRLRHSGAKHLQHVAHADPHPANARFSPALFRVDRDAFSEIHTRKLFTIPPLAKLSPEMRPKLRAEIKGSGQCRVHLRPWIGRGLMGSGAEGVSLLHVALVRVLGGTVGRGTCRRNMQQADPSGSLPVGRSQIHARSSPEWVNSTRLRLFPTARDPLPLPA